MPKRKAPKEGTRPAGTLFHTTDQLERDVLRAAIDWSTGNGTADRLFQLCVRLEARYRVMATPARMPRKKARPSELENPDEGPGGGSAAGGQPSSMGAEANE